MNEARQFDDFVKEVHSAMELDPDYEIGTQTSAEVLKSFLQRAYAAGQHVGREAVGIIMLNRTNDSNREEFLSVLEELKKTPIVEADADYGWSNDCV